MPRLNWQEFSDQAWLPSPLRRGITAYLDVMHDFLGSPRFWAPVAAQVLNRPGQTTTVVDLCSGSGGPARRLQRVLAETQGLALDLTLTDLYPDRSDVARINGEGRANLRYAAQKVDAAAVPDTMDGARTMICGFHHLPSSEATRVLADAAANGRPLLIFEVTDRDLLSLATALFVTPLLVLLLTPRIRPLHWSALVFTYLLPLLPLMIAWDHFASCLRTFTQADLRQLSSTHQVPGYTWRVGAIGPRWLPMRWPYLIGYPDNSERSAIRHSNLEVIA